MSFFVVTISLWGYGLGHGTKEHTCMDNTFTIRRECMGPLRLRETDSADYSLSGKGPVMYEVPGW
jgi:hypothetical protein